MKKLLAVSLFVVVALVALAQGSAEAQQRPFYTLRNDSNQTLRFQTLDFARNTWKDQLLYPNQKVSYTITSGLQVGKIRIATAGRGQVKYDVNAGWAYKIVWDGNKGVWDFRTTHRIY